MPPTPAVNRPVRGAASVTTTERAVQQLLAGSPLNATAAAAGIPADDLAAAADAYQHAGSQALRQRAAEYDQDWYQVYVQLPDWSTAEQTAAEHLVPILDSTGASWWYIRKHPCWRVRAQPSGDTTTVDLAVELTVQLDDLASHGVIQRWWTGIYEPETAAFGGDEAMAQAHTLFAADSRAILGLTATPAALGRRELWTLMCATLMRAAGLEWYERGDVWHRITRERPLPADVPADKVDELARNVRGLLGCDTAADGPLFTNDAPLAPFAAWAGAFRDLGVHLGAANRTGELRRGIRDVIAYHAIFHANRLGLSDRAQSILAHAARAAVLDIPVRHTAARPGPRQAAPLPASVRRRTSPAPTATATAAIARFPLILQGRRRCPDLDTRIAEIQHFADACHDTTADDLARIDRACSVWNLAALTAADCGMPDLAAELCADEFRILHAAWPVSGPTAIAALQPLVNLARLTSRAGDPHGAHRTYEAINRAVHHGGKVHIHGLHIDFDDFTATTADRTDVAAWLRVTLREDGTRALAAAGDWAAAAAHAARYDDNPHLLRESRQARVLAAAASQETDTALALIDTSASSEPWEHAVAACLRAHSAAMPHAEMLHTVRQALTAHDSASGLALFSIRLGLTALDLTPTSQPAEARPVREHLLRIALDIDDAFLAREVLAHPASRAATNAEERATLEERIELAGLGRGRIPSHHMDAVIAATRTASAALADVLGVPAPNPSRG